MKRQNTWMLYLQWFGHSILAILDCLLLIPLAVVLVVALIVRRGQVQRQALNLILAELRELPTLSRGSPGK